MAKLRDTTLSNGRARRYGALISEGKAKGGIAKETQRVAKARHRIQKLKHQKEEESRNEGIESKSNIYGGNFGNSKQ